MPTTRLRFRVLQAQSDRAPFLSMLAIATCETGHKQRLPAARVSVGEHLFQVAQRLCPCRLYVVQLMLHTYGLRPSTLQFLTSRRDSARLNVLVGLAMT